MKDTFRQSFLARGFMEHQLGARMKIELPEMLAYYNAHLKEFDRPAQDSWREVVVEVDKCPDRAAARRKAEELFARLRRGDDFAKVAEAESAGPNRSRGGLWETAPGSYGVEAVNAALRTLPIGEISPILEGPSSYHIVRVEARRPAGPANFAEVQDKIKRTLRGQKVQRETTTYLDKLRKQMVITTMFDGTASAPVPRPPLAPQ